MNAEVDDRTVVYWDCSDDAEILNYSIKKEAIESYLDGRNQWNGTIKVYGYAHMVASKPTIDDAVDLVDHWFEMNWEELQGEDGFDAPNSTVEAALVFLTVLHKDFVPWACEQITSEEVDVGTWIAENRPDWLKEKL